MVIAFPARSVTPPGPPRTRAENEWFGANGAFGVRVAELPLDVTLAGTAVDAVVSVKVKVEPVIVPDAMDSLKVALTRLEVLTAEAPFAGEVAVTVGGVVSLGPPGPIEIPLWT